MFALKWSVFGLVASVSAVPVELERRSTEVPIVAQSSGQTLLLNATPYYVPSKPEVHPLVNSCKQ